MTERRKHPVSTAGSSIAGGGSNGQATSFRPRASNSRQELLERPDVVVVDAGEDVGEPDPRIGVVARYPWRSP